MFQFIFYRRNIFVLLWISEIFQGLVQNEQNKERIAVQLT